MDPRNPNVINYDTKNMVIHRVGHLVVDKETGETSPYENEKTIEALEDSLLNVQKSKEQDDYGVQVNAIRNLEKAASDEAAMVAKERVSDLMRENGLSDNDTVGDFIVRNVSELVYSNFPDLNEDTKLLIVNRILGQKGSSLTKIMSNIPKDQPGLRELARQMVKDSKKILSKIIYPLEDIIHDFSVEILRGLESAFIIDNKKEVERLRDEVAKAIEAIEGSKSDEAMEILNTQIQKIKSIENVATAAEGFVFDYDGNTYKFTGNFAPANQILGLFKYGRGNIPPIKRLTEKKSDFNRVVALFPGKFKPPHAGHLGAVEKVYDTADEVFILVSPRKQKGVAPEAAREIWNIYLSRYNLDDRADVFVSTQLFPDAKSPVQATYQFIENFVEKGDKVILVLGEKDIRDGRYIGAARVGNDRGVDVELMPIPPQAGGMSASGDMKPAMEDGDSEKFKSLLPGELTPEEKEEVWNLTKGLKEMSSMAAGSVAGSMGKRKEEDSLIKREEVNMRQEMIAELKIRELVREKLKRKQKSKKHSLLSENKEVIFINENQKKMLDEAHLEYHLRKHIRELILQEKQEMPPHRNTGINVLAQLLKRIVPVIKKDFKTLTTDDDQRQSYRSHIVNQTVKSLAPIELADEADEEAAKLDELEVDIDDDTLDTGKFIDIGDDSVAKMPEDEKFETLPGMDMTGRNVAERTFENIGKQIIDAYSILDNDKDQTMFYEYLIANLKLYLDKFEKELPATVPEPTNATYEKEKESPGPEGEQVIEEPPMEEPEEEPLGEVSSEKQRKWACAQTKGRREKFKGKLSLTPKEAEEMCSAEIEKPKK
jgi:phosphopantetheine adenylyltransferase